MSKIDQLIAQSVTLYKLIDQNWTNWPINLYFNRLICRKLVPTPSPSVHHPSPLSKIRHEGSPMGTFNSPGNPRGSPIGPQLALIGAKLVKKDLHWIFLWLICVKIDQLIDLSVTIYRLIDQNWSNLEINCHINRLICRKFSNGLGHWPSTLVHLTKIGHHWPPMKFHGSPWNAFRVSNCVGKPDTWWKFVKKVFC